MATYTGLQFFEDMVYSHSHRRPTCFLIDRHRGRGSRTQFFETSFIATQKNQKPLILAALSARATCTIRGGRSHPIHQFRGRDRHSWNIFTRTISMLQLFDRILVESWQHVDWPRCGNAQWAD